jgi:glycosyltransferase involved in cell wall biosynthesis
MRIGWTSNAPWAPTGYGVQTQEVVPQLIKNGHDVAIMANYGLTGATINFNGITVMGSGMDAYSNDITPAQIVSWAQKEPNKIGLGISLYDVWVYTNPAWDDVPMLSWTPIDHEVVPEGVLQWFGRIGGGKWALAMSRFGEQQLLESGVERERVFYAPHSFNGNIFKPTRTDIRSRIGIPQDAHLTMINSANKGLTPIRKCWPEMLEAWCKFSENRKDAYLYIHTEFFGLANGVKIGRLLETFKAPIDRVKIVPQFEFRQGIPQEVLAELYTASDVLLMTSRGEGFGIPTIEAQACGTPVIVTDWTAQPELVGAGWKVGGQREWDELQTGWWKVPSVDEIVDALEQSYRAKGNKIASEQMSKKATKFASAYETNYVYNTHWKPILAEIESRLLQGKK